MIFFVFLLYFKLNWNWDVIFSCKLQEKFVFQRDFSKFSHVNYLKIHRNTFISSMRTSAAPTLSSVPRTSAMAHTSVRRSASPAPYSGAGVQVSVAMRVPPPRPPPPQTPLARAETLAAGVSSSVPEAQPQLSSHQSAHSGPHAYPHHCWSPRGLPDFCSSVQHLSIDNSSAGAGKTPRR